MDRRLTPAQLRSVPPALLLAGSLVVLALATVAVAPQLLPLVVAVAAGSAVLARHAGVGGGLQIDQMEHLREAELALATAGTTEAAAGRLAQQAMHLLGAPSATVLIEGIGDTVRVTAGDPDSSVFGPGSRMRLLDDDGLPCGSIAVPARADGRPYTRQQERMLDALAQRVSSTLHRLSLFTEVQHERRTLEDVVGSSSDGILAVGVDLLVRSWNPAMAAITGVPAAMAEGRPVADVFRPVDLNGRARSLPSLAARAPDATLVRIEGAGGELRWLTCSASPLSEGGFVVVARDETERKKLQDDKDGWIAQVSHELRTPLTPIKGFLQTLQRRDGELEPEARQRIYEVMLREELRLENLVQGLLQATTIDQGGLVVLPREISWQDLVTEQVDLFRHSDPPRRIRLSVGRGAERVLADPALATSVLSNLLSNAIKYSPPGSPLDVAVALDGDLVRTTVRDHGAGVGPGDRDRIFDKFTRLGDHLTRAQQGVGLGLYIARRSVEKLGGEIWCDDAPGGGSVFGFSLPVAEPARARGPVGAAS